jgi:hypothetical protein
MALGSQELNNHIELLLKALTTNKKKLPQRIPPKKKISPTQLDKKANLALFLAKLQPENQEIKTNEKSLIISQPSIKKYQLFLSNKTNIKKKKDKYRKVNIFILLPVDI